MMMKDIKIKTNTFIIIRIIQLFYIDYYDWEIVLSDILFCSDLEHFCKSFLHKKKSRDAQDNIIASCTERFKTWYNQIHTFLNWCIVSCFIIKKYLPRPTLLSAAVTTTNYKRKKKGSSSRILKPLYVYTYILAQIHITYNVYIRWRH